MRPGLKLHSSTCETELIVIRAAATPTALTCGGAAVGTEPVAVTDRQPVDPGAASGTLLGKRYVDAAGTLEVLCTRAGAGSLALDGVPLEIKAAKPLPASD
ncbi:MAG: hypothetical protein ABT15_01215 [Pseudonocardia sp. SCN 73-27]|nr:MAG: hypothetical protein ABS80_03825 [Pseudonocardia sp. SCN 72-51]ODV09015.1 MAG: hypothetical protein ABT15_01215 [Pseudonocardia sp. SCN 73-27]